MTESQCRNEIINYILYQQGCSKEEACHALRDKISRNTFFKYLFKLIDEGQILVVHKNRRDTKLFVAKDNPLLLVPEQLENFIRAYKQLLHVSKKRIRERDLTRIAKIRGIGTISNSKR